MQIKVAKLQEDAVLPTRKHPTDAGMDVYAWGNYIIEPQRMVTIKTEITIEVPKGCAIFVWPKSSSNNLIGGGVIDEGYQGEILVKVVNIGRHNHVISGGDAIAQLVITPVLTPEVVEVPKDQIHKVSTPRGDTGGIKGEQIAMFNSVIELVDEEPDKFHRWWD